MEKVAFDELLPASSPKAGLFTQFSLGRLQEIAIQRATAFGNLPAVRIECKPILADEERMFLGIHGHDSKGLVLEVHRAIDACVPGRRNDFVVRHTTPAIVVFLMPGDDAPRSSL